MEIVRDFFLTSVSGTIPQRTAPAANPLGPLADLSGTWKGHGFNQIWRPFHGTQDRFLELNETNETMQFDEFRETSQIGACFKLILICTV